VSGLRYVAISSFDAVFRNVVTIIIFIVRFWPLCECNAEYWQFLIERYENDFLLPDINECSENPGACSQFCVNTLGSYICKCAEGYVKTADNRTCKRRDGMFCFRVVALKKFCFASSFSKFVMCSSVGRTACLARPCVCPSVPYGRVPQKSEGGMEKPKSFPSTPIPKGGVILAVRTAVRTVGVFDGRFDVRPDRQCDPSFRPRHNTFVAYGRTDDGRQSYHRRPQHLQSVCRYCTFLDIFIASKIESSRRNSNIDSVFKKVHPPWLRILYRFFRKRFDAINYKINAR